MDHWKSGGNEIGSMDHADRVLAEGEHQQYEDDRREARRALEDERDDSDWDRDQLTPEQEAISRSEHAECLAQGAEVVTRAHAAISGAKANAIAALLALKEAYAAHMVALQVPEPKLWDQYWEQHDTLADAIDNRGYGVQSHIQAVIDGVENDLKYLAEKRVEYETF